MLASWSSAFAAGESGFSSKMFNPPSQHLTNSCVSKQLNFIYTLVSRRFDSTSLLWHCSAIICILTGSSGMVPSRGKLVS